MKICSKCKYKLNLDNFYKSSNKLDGYQSYCKECSNKRYFNRTKKYKQNIVTKEYRRTYVSNRSKIDPMFRLIRSLRVRTVQILRGKSKSKSTIKMLGCSVEELKLHLETKFQSGMTWNNYGFGKDRWSLDHIIPLSTANSTVELEKLNHYSNLQPMWFLDNIKKGNKLINQGN